MKLSKSILGACLVLFSNYGFAKSKKEILTDFQNKKTIILDVREFDEIKEGMVDGAIWIPFSEIKNKKGDRYTQVMQSLDKTKEIQVYCAVGGRAGTIKNMLAANDYKIGNLGGFKDLQVAGFPVKKIDKTSPENCPWLCPEQAEVKK